MYTGLIALLASLACIFAPLMPTAHRPHAVQLIEVKDSSLKNLVYGVTERYIDLDRSKYTIKQHSADDDIAEGGSYSTIYYIIDEQNTPLYVIKLMDISDSHSLQEWNREWESLTKLHKLSNRTFHSIKPIAHVKANLNETTYGIFIEERAEGKSISSLLKSYYFASDSNEKEQIFTKIKAALKATGASIANLHKSTQMKRLNPYYIKRLHRVQNEFGQEITTKLPGPYSYIHGDLHLGNVFFDEKQNKATLIDLGSSYPSFKGGPSADDLALAITSIELLGSYYGLTELQIIDLSDTFLDSYRASGGLQISDDTIELYYALFAIEITQNTPSSPNHMETYALNFANDRLPGSTIKT